MGIIRKQSITSSFIIYTGFFIGAINTWLFTTGHYFTAAEYGLIGILLNIAQYFFALANLGTLPVLYRFYPYYRDNLPLQKRDLFGKATIIAIIGFVAVCLCSFLFKDLVVTKFGTNSPLLIKYFYTVYPLSLFLLLFSLLEAQAWNHFSSVAANFQKELVMRLFTSFLIILFLFKVLNYEGFINLFSFVYAFIFLGLLIYLYRKGQISFALKTSVVTRRLRKKMISLGAFVYMVALFTILAKNFDNFIISSVLGLAQNGIFTFASYITSTMEGPQRGLIAVSVPIIAQAWKDKDMKRIESIYRKTALNMLLFSCFLFGLIWLNYHNAFEILNINRSYLAGQNVLLLLGLTKIVELGTGVNAQIIVTSRYWKVDLVTTAALLCILIPLNYLLIKKYGIDGSAAASLIAYIIFNLIRYIFIWVKFKMQPFTWRNAAVIVITVIGYWVAHSFINMHSALLDAIVQSTVYVVVCAALIVPLRVSDDLNRLYALGLERVKRVLGR
ncbi:lipopolysaccharide biosynthesis protein [Chitinophaga sp. GbtcB8]|uniref:lipopolysaccharide biosynthesis protein n=1 Tax=Chitinophaga sp. GbtcB8 TaxID=2824753 RepID=UPI001C3082AD|nr:oligosaccharide flippase family protein [Chitinophaga sp. GbtcB8]